jgi:hypothetical protein
MGLEDEVADNARRTRRVESYFAEPAPSTATRLSFRPARVGVEIDVTVKARTIADGLVVGAEDAANAVGRGVVGDRRGGYSEVQTSEDGTLTEAGRAAFAAALTSASVSLDRLTVGLGDSPPTPSDDGLDAPVAAADADALRDGLTTDLRARFAVTDRTADGLSEAAIESDGGETVARAVYPNLSLSAGQEIRVTTSLTYSGGSVGSVSVPGLDRVADAHATDDIGLDEIAVGTDDAAPSDGDTDLGNAVARRTAEIGSDGPTARARTVVVRGDPPTQPHDIREAGLFAADGTLLVRRTFGAERKDDRTRLAVIDGFNFQ